ncbi:MAG: peptide-methionine (S)-S-oxide reductase MsrA [Chitinophagaceae bacterium]
MTKTIYILTVLSLMFVACGAQTTHQNQNSEQAENTIQHIVNPSLEIDTIVLGGGCFWCIEAQLQQLEGVIHVQSGYAGGHTKKPSYKDVCNGTSGHAEVIQLIYKPNMISYEEILYAFWQAHDPTQHNRQGNDVGTQYRSVIFYRNAYQKQIAEQYKQKLNTERIYNTEVVTEISPLKQFYPAEDYHQNYYNENATQGYCQYVIAPKLEKFKTIFKEKIKK